MPGSTRLPFNINQSLSFPGLFQLSGVCIPLGYMCFDMPLFFEIFVCFDMSFLYEIFADRRRRGQLVS